MNNYVNAVVLARTPGSQWQALDISQESVDTIYRTFSQVFLTVYNTVLNLDRYVNFIPTLEQYSSYQGTLTQLLVDLGDTTLTVVDSLPSTEIKFAKYANGVQAQYHAELCLMGQNLPPDYPRNLLVDLKINRPRTNTIITKLHTHCLMSVNGFYHSTDTDGSFTYIKDGARSLNKCNDNHYGILSFEDVGALTKVRFNANQINPALPNNPLADKVLLSTTESLDNKSYILVVGGYLVFPQEGVFWRNSDSSFMLDLNRLNYIERIYESNLTLDLSPLQLTTNPINESMINVGELWSDEVIRRYLMMSQSFLVLVDTPAMVVDREYIVRSSIPGLFSVVNDPQYPLIVNFGKQTEYWKTMDDRKWIVAVQDAYDRNYILTSTNQSLLQNVTDDLNPMSDNNRNSSGYLLRIGGYQI